MNFHSHYTSAAFLSLLFSFLINSLNGQNILELNKQEIKCGDTIHIFFSNKFPGSHIKVINPAGKQFMLEPEKTNNGFIANFATDETRGFLIADWNKYSIYLLNKNKLIDSSVARLANSEKILYFTIFIDDIGPYGFVNEDDYNWFKNKGGKFNIGYMHDDFGMEDLGFVQEKYSDPTGYIFHHFHAQRFSGNRFLLEIYLFTRWKNFKTSVSNLIHYDLRDRHFLLFSFGLSVLILLSVFIFSRNKTLRTIVLTFILIFNFFLFGIILTYVYVVDEEKKEVMLADAEWCKTFLKEAKTEFEQNGINYPRITRHGWTIPPRGFGEFYLFEMGVIADQSLDYQPFLNKYFYEGDHGFELNQVFSYHIYTWPKNLPSPVPFYTKLDGDINQMWDGNEDNRGIIEIPSTHGPYATQVYDEKALQRCDSLPNGALVSCWGHPNKRIENAKPLLEYVENNFKIRQVNAKEYLDIFMANNPRPILIDAENKQAFWAYVGRDEIKKIVACNLVTFHENDFQYNLVNDPPVLILTKNADTSSLSSKYNFERESDNYFIFKMKK